MAMFRKNLLFIIVLSLIVFVSQFILAGKQLEYGFHKDDWYVLTWYKQYVNNPLLDIFKAWRDIGVHNFTHTYYIGILFELFKYNYPLYHIVGTILKSFAVLSFFPVVYLLFRNRLLAFLSILILAFHVSPFGVIFHIIPGEDSLLVVSLNLFLVVYIYAAQKRILNNIKVLLILWVIFFLTIFIDVTRTFPLIALLPLLEIANILIYRQSASFKASALRLSFFYSPILLYLIYSPTTIREISFDKFIRIKDWGNYQLLLSIFSSFGSTFIPKDLLPIFGKFHYQNLKDFLFISLPWLSFIFFLISAGIGILSVQDSKRFILRCMAIFICFLFLAFWLANHWLFLDPKFQAPVDPSTYLIPAVIGLFIISTAISYLIEWIREKKNCFFLALSLIPLSSLGYTLFTWMLVDDNSIFMGVHAYLNIPALAASLYLAIILYAAWRRVTLSQPKTLDRFVASVTLIFFLAFFAASIHEINEFFSYWFKNGYAIGEQERMYNSFWKEVGLKKYSKDSLVLIYFDGSQDSANSYFYENSFIWSIPSMLIINNDLAVRNNDYCKVSISSKDFDKMRIETIKNEKVIVQNTCGYDIFYKLENFFAFKMINRDLIPIKSDVLKELGFEAANE